MDLVQIPDAIQQIEKWIQARDQCRFIAVTGMHGVTEAQHDSQFKKILNSANLVVADGMPLVWLGRRRDFSMRRRVYGPELLETFCSQTAGQSIRHFFYGGGPGVADELARRLFERFPRLQVVGTFCPPFRPLTDGEEAEFLRIIHHAQPDIIWVGLSTPKQEKWMYEYKSKLNVPVLVGVGAAFDFHAGRVKQAPEWMREHGLEWLFRLSREPRRLWRRYLLYGFEFLWLVMLESLGLRKFR